MDIWILVGIIVFISAIIMPWVAIIKIINLRREVNVLKKIISQIVPGSYMHEVKDDLDAKIDNFTSTDTPHKEKDIKVESPTIVKHSFRDSADPIKSKIRVTTKPKVTFEQQFGARLPVWIGGIALALSGLFLVKYSIENNLLSPAIRVTLGAIFGIMMLYSSKWVRGRPSLANEERIAQSLSGAGIAVLYLASFAASKLYGLIPDLVGFVVMAIVTATALILSLRHGPPIALIGMAGGFLTPALLDTGSGSAFSLFIYLYFTASGLLMVVRRTSWWWMSIPTILLSLSWVIIWLFSNNYSPTDNIWLGLFLLGISATIIINSRQKSDDEEGINSGTFRMIPILNYIGLAGTLMIMGLVAGKSGFGFIEWGLFGLLALGGMVLTYSNDKMYGFVPWISMAVNIVMLFLWKTSDNASFALILCIFALIYVGGSYFLMWRSKTPNLWAGVSGASILSYYFLAYHKLHETSLLVDYDLFWGLTAFVLAAISAYAVQQVRSILNQHPYEEYITAIYAIICTTFISTGLFVELKTEFLSVALVTQILAISWINNRVSIKVLRSLVIVIACIFGILLVPQILLLMQLTIYSLVEAKVHLQESVPIVNWPIFQLGIPAAMFLGSSYFLSKQEKGRLTYFFDIAAIVLIAVMGYYLTRNILNPGQNVLFIKAGFFERGVISNIIFLYGLGCFLVGRKFNRESFSISAVVLCVIAIFRVIYFDIILHNPFLKIDVVNGVVIFNTLFITYGLPLIWSYLAKREFFNIGYHKITNYLGGFMLLSLFTLVTLNIRYLFIENSSTDNAEIYSYSISWLLLGAALLFGGLTKKDKMMRYASLVIILLVIGKVFLYDASELEGLYRVFSFFGLGLSLIGLSYIYTRFVFNEKIVN